MNINADMHQDLGMRLLVWNRTCSIGKVACGMLYHYFTFHFTVCSAKVIFESDLMQDFLCLKGGVPVTPPTSSKSTPTTLRSSSNVEFVVATPSNTKMTLSLPEISRAPDVLDVSNVCI